MITIIDYGVANLGSMLNMLKRIGVQALLASDPETIAAATKIILPGVGSFDHGMENLTSLQLIAPIKRRVQEYEIPILGVCLGAQLLGTSSAEGNRNGLGLVDFRCERLPTDVAAGIRVPHMGWNYIFPTRDDRLLHGLGEDARFYFVHSYYMACKQATDVLAVTKYGIEFPSIFQVSNIYGAQFHPEKSHRFGMQLLKNFVEL